MTINEKAKAYDELIAKLIKAKEDDMLNDERYCCVIDEIVPELKENKDEGIRKSLISYLHGLGEFDYPDKETYNNWLVWLEKQGEPDIEEPNFFDDFRKTDSEVEPKLNVGDRLKLNGIEDTPIVRIIESIKEKDGNYIYNLTDDGTKNTYDHC